MTFDEVLRSRRMVRNLSAEPIADEQLDRVLDAGRRAPSAGKTQALDLVVLAGEGTRRLWDVTLPDPSGFRWQGLLQAPVVVLPVVDPQAYPDRYGEPDKARTGLGEGTDAWPVPYWWVDAGMAIENLLLAATAEHLGACFFGLFEHEAAVQLALGIPADRRVVGAVALGHPMADEPGRSAARRRRPLDDVVHRDGW